MRLFGLLSIILIMLLVIAAGFGLLADGVYRDNLLVTSGWYGNDLVTLILVLPLLVISTILVLRRSLSGALIWAGIMAYALYCYAFYLFGAAFNSLYLVYVAILAVSTFGLIRILTSPQIRHIAHSVNFSIHTGIAGILLILTSAALGSFWIMTSILFLLTGEVPAMVTAVDHPTNVTGALDLWLVVSFGLLGGIWLLQRRAWGYIIAAIWSIKGLLYMSAISAAAVAQYIYGAAENLAQLFIWVPIGLICLVNARLLLQVCPRREKRSGHAGSYE